MDSLAKSVVSKTAPAALQYQLLWRLGFLMSFFFSPEFVDQWQLNLSNNLTLHRRATGAALTIFLILYSYFLGGELFRTARRLMRFFLVALFPVWAFLVALALLIMLGTSGEIWFLRGICLLLVASVTRYVLSFQGSPQFVAPALAFADFTYLGSVFFAVLNRHYRQWSELASFTMGDLGAVQSWTLLAAALFFLITVALCFAAARISQSQAVEHQPEV